MFPTGGLGTGGREPDFRLGNAGALALSDNAQLLFVVILLAIVADNVRDPCRHHLWAADAWYAFAVAGLVAAYYVAHAELFGTAII